MLIINVVSLMQKYRIMHNKATTSSNFLLYPVIFFVDVRAFNSWL